MYSFNTRKCSRMISAAAMRRSAAISSTFFGERKRDVWGTA